MFNIKNKKLKYLIACSGGPDSMALLDMARNNLKNIEVAHVNYHKRDTAIRDEKIVRKYCKKYNIKCNVLQFDPNSVKGNFQAFARKSRYEYFAKICNKHNLDAVLVAHQKDDLIETYLMQIDRKLGVDYYGLAYNNCIYDANVVRPLLDYTKEDLINYCKDSCIEYGIDESNNTNDYERNRVRHSKIDNMSLSQKNKIVKEIIKKNEITSKQRLKALSYLGKQNDFTVKEFLKIPYIKEGLRVLFGSNSDKFFDEMLRQIKDSDKYLYKGEIYWISKEYGYVHIFFRPLPYEYKIKNLDCYKNIYCEYFKLAKSGNSTEGVSLTKNDFPITIRNIKDGDKIEMLYGTKKLNRFFIDNKILIKDRLSWPIMLDKLGNAILVPGIGCNKAHYTKKHNLYMVKLS